MYEELVAVGICFKLSFNVWRIGSCWNMFYVKFQCIEN